MAWKDVDSLVKFCQYLYAHYEELSESVHAEPPGE
jgi:hypothetical protein